MNSLYTEFDIILIALHLTLLHVRQAHFICGKGWSCYDIVSNFHPATVGSDPVSFETQGKVVPAHGSNRFF